MQKAELLASRREKEGERNYNSVNLQQSQLAVAFFASPGDEKNRKGNSICQNDETVALITEPRSIAKWIK
jgi:hypothetical protein